MEIKSFLLNKEIILIFILFFRISFSQNSIIPIYKLLITRDINNFKTSDLSNYYYNTKGVGLVFNNNSDISIMPMHIFSTIYNYYQMTYEPIDKIETLSNGYKQYLLIESLRPDETIHFILKDIGITLPIKELFIDKEEEEDFVYFFRFLTKDDQENIIIGKDLIELIDIQFLDNDNFIINNKDYISNIKD